MEDKQYDPAGNNEKAPEKGMAAVNTFNEGESDTTGETDFKKKKEENVPTEISPIEKSKEA
ncbi:MAG: hypothetical protein ABIN57_11105 [Chitinophagaceae bacterium]